MEFRDEILGRGKAGTAGGFRACGGLCVNFEKEDPRNIVRDEDVHVSSNRFERLFRPRGLDLIWQVTCQHLMKDEGSGEAPPDPAITLGPIVGVVTETTARILIETNTKCSISATLEGVMLNEKRTIHSATFGPIECQRDVPTVFDCTNLVPNTQYTVTFDQPVVGVVTCTFTTKNDSIAPNDLVGKMNTIKVALTSGNQITMVEDTNLKSQVFGTTHKRPLKATHPTQKSLWKDLYKRIRKEDIQTVVHCGNNVFIGGNEPDTLFQQLVEAEATYDVAFAAIQERYRQYWNEPWTKQVLASCSNVFLLNECDIGNLKVVGQSKSSESAKSVVAGAARQCFKIYQNLLNGGDGSSYVHSVGLGKQARLYMADLMNSAVDQRTGVLSSIMKEIHRHDQDFDVAQTLKHREALVAAAEEMDTDVPDYLLRYNPGYNDLVDSPLSTVVICLSLSLTNPLSHLHSHSELRDELKHFLMELHQWRSLAPREVIFVAAANRSDGFTDGVGNITLTKQGYEVSGTNTPCEVKNDIFDTRAVSLSRGCFGFECLNVFNPRIDPATSSAYKLNMARSLINGDFKEFVIGPIAAKPYKPFLTGFGKMKKVLLDNFTMRRSSTHLPGLNKYGVLSLGHTPMPGVICSEKTNEIVNQPTGWCVFYGTEHRPSQKQIHEYVTPKTVKTSKVKECRPIQTFD